MLAEQFEKYVDGLNNFSVEYPASWKAYKLPHSKNLIKASFEKDKGTAFEVRVYPSSQSFEDFIVWYIEDYTLQMTTRGKSLVEPLDEKLVQTQGENCFVSTLKLKNSHGDWFVQQVIFPGQGKYYVLQFGTPWQARTQNDYAINHAAQTFKINRINY
jgi:hypothetical protein